MIVMIVAMLVCVAAGAVVVGYVAVEARREGRAVLTPQGEELLAGAKRQGDELREGIARKAARSLERSPK